jgi:hypothetical protein
VTADVGCALHFVGRLAWDALFLRLLPLLERHELRGVALIRAFQYDETPLRMSIAESPEGKGGKKDKQDKKLVKICQCQVEIGFVVVGPATGGKPMMVLGELLCPLMALERNSGEVVVEALDRSAVLQFYDALRPYFNVVLDLSCCDSAKSNLRAEQEIALRCPSILRLTLPCTVHQLSTVQSKSFATCESDLSGMIATAMCQKIAGGTAGLREAMLA